MFSLNVASVNDKEYKLKVARLYECVKREVWQCRMLNHHHHSDSCKQQYSQRLNSRGNNET